MDLNKIDKVTDLTGQVDFAIITIKEEEFDAVLDQLGCLDAPIISGERPYVVAEIPAADGSGAFLVAVTRCPTQGNGVASFVARDIMRELDPRWILVVGIAGGTPATEYCLGDVVLARSVVDFRVEKVRDKDLSEFDAEGLPVHLDVRNYVALATHHSRSLGPWNEIERTRNGVKVALDYPPAELGEDRFYGDDEWQAKVKEALEHWHKRETKLPKVSSAKVASSDRLITGTDPFKVLIPAMRKIGAVEMESAGVFQAADPTSKTWNYPVLSIRGLSDIVGYRRDERWTEYACHSAAAFAAAFIRSGQVFKPGEPRPNPRQPLL